MNSLSTHYFDFLSVCNCICMKGVEKRGLGGG